MEINFHGRNVSAASVTPTSARAPENHASTPRDEVALENSRALTQALSSTPASRAELVRRATELVGQPDYPPPETIRKISHLLAIQIQMHPEA